MKLQANYIGGQPATPEQLREVLAALMTAATRSRFHSIV
jgi:hypothetical protein